MGGGTIFASSMSLRPILICVSSDIATDQRVLRAAASLHRQGRRVEVWGRKRRNSPQLPDLPFPVRRFNLLIEKGVGFYFLLNLRLFWALMLSKNSTILSNDLDTLAACGMVATLRKWPLVYDSHELFTEVPELSGRRFVKSVWERIEGTFIRRVASMYTVNESIAAYYREKYKREVRVIRNVPEPYSEKLPDRAELRRELGLPADSPIFILQGSGINVDRGAEEALLSLAFYPEAHLLLVGSGDVWPVLKQMAIDQKLTNRVHFVGRQSATVLRRYTAAADAGLSLDKNTNLNYYYSLPNKLFDYIQAQIPTIASPLPEIERILIAYSAGIICRDHNPETIAECMHRAIEDENLRSKWRESLPRAAEELNWSKEEKILLSIFTNY